MQKIFRHEVWIFSHILNAPNVGCLVVKVETVLEVEVTQLSQKGSPRSKKSIHLENAGFQAELCECAFWQGSNLYYETARVLLVQNT